MSDDDRSGVRLGVLGLIVFTLFGILLIRLWSLQVLDVEEYVDAAEANRYETIPVPAQRGRILDRNGKVLVDNRVSIVLTVDPQKVAEAKPDEAARNTYLAQVSELLVSFGIATTADGIADRLTDKQFDQLTPRPVAEGVPESLEIYLGEKSTDWPGVSVERRWVRSYPYGRLAAHVLGYVGAINEDELATADRRGSDKPYALGDVIGKAGAERVYEDFLRGNPGSRVVEVDSQNRVVGERLQLGKDPVPGYDLRLTIDIDLQAAAETALGEMLEARRSEIDNDGIRFEAPGGSVIVEDPRDGDILAMASYPTYDPAEFLGGIAPDRFAQLNSHENDAPLLNRAIQGTYAPGSTFKLITSYAALAEGLITPESTYEDRGTYTIPDCTGERCSPSNPDRRSWGTVDVRRAMSVSSDVFFYWLGDRFWSQPDINHNGIQDTARLFGFGRQTGIPLPAEVEGIVPTSEDRETQREASEDPSAIPPWRSGDNVNLATGQGDLLVTPMQLTNAYATLANGGSHYQPNIADAVLDIDRVTDEAVEVQTFGPRVADQVEFPAAIRDPLIDGLRGTISDEDGTAHLLFQGFEPAWAVAAKTGTAQRANKTDTSVFVGYGPTETPRVVVTALLEESGFGADAAGPIVRRLLEMLSGQRELPVYPAAGTVPDPAADYASRWVPLVADPAAPDGTTATTTVATGPDEQP